jgi:hypothetical protein
VGAGAEMLSAPAISHTQWVGDESGASGDDGMSVVAGVSTFHSYSYVFIILSIKIYIKIP